MPTPLILLPGALLHAPFYADTREARSRVAVHSAGLEAALAEEIAIVGQSGAGPVSWSAGLMGAAFMGFDPAGELTFNLLTFDGLFGVPIDVVFPDKSWEFRVAWVHLSAHFADGIRLAGLRPEPGAIGPYSREWVQFQAASRWAMLRPYVGARYVVHAADDGFGGALQAGFTADGEGTTAMFGGADAQSWQEHGWVPTVSAQAGARWRGEDSGHLLRLGLVAYRGLDDAGKRASDREVYVGLSLGVEPADAGSWSSAMTGR